MSEQTFGRRPCADAWREYGRTLNVTVATKTFAAIDDELDRLRKRVEELEACPHTKEKP